MAGKVGPWYIECTKKSLLFEMVGGTSILPKRAISFSCFLSIVDTFSAQSSGENGTIVEKRSVRLCPRILTAKENKKNLGDNSDCNNVPFSERPHQAQSFIRLQKNKERPKQPFHGLWDTLFF
ncbi:hypothetical protein [Paenibacillus polymyxa]|uniref:hypothetical protein n=1 Tax=Paenibacillus polymyxa TaxID=1406 RepID=UPI001687789F|nr:hypothetical protein [Paenibacillus polymyxa]